MKKLIFISMLLTSFFSNYAQTRPEQISAQIAIYENQIPDVYFIDSLQHKTFKFFVDYIKAVYPNRSTEKYNTAAATLTNGIYSGSCSGVFQSFQGSESDLDSIKIKMLTLLRYHWKNLVLKYPNRDNVILEVAAKLTVSSLIMYCDTWFTPDTTTPPVIIDSNTFIIDTIIYNTVNQFYTIFKNQTDTFYHLKNDIVYYNPQNPLNPEEHELSDIIANFIMFTRSGLHGSVVHNIYDSLFVYTPSLDYTGFDTIYYSAWDNYLVKNNPEYPYNQILYFSSDTGMIVIQVVDTISSFFDSLQLNVCTENIQGRLTWELAAYTIDGVTDFDIISATLSVPNATPSSVFDNTITGLDDLLTPSSSDQRDKLALGGENNQIIIDASFTFNSIFYVVTIVFDLPVISESANSCWNLTGTYSEN